MDTAADGLLVVRHVTEDRTRIPGAVRRERRNPVRKAGAAQMAAHAVDDRAVAVAELRRERGGGRESGRHRLAVPQRAVPGLGLDGVGEGVTEVHERAVATVAFVRGDDSRLRLAAEPHRLDQRTGVEREQGSRVSLEPAELLLATQEAALHDLAVAGQ